MAPAGAPPGAAPGAPPGGGATGPAGAPMATPQKKAGAEASGATLVQLSMTFLQQAATKYPFGSKESKVILKILSDAAKVFGPTEEVAKAAMPAQIRQILSMPGGKPAGAPAAPPPPGGAAAPAAAA